MRYSIAVALMILLALVVRLPLLSGSFWLDEAAQALESARPLSQQLNISEDFQPPLLHLIVHFTLFFGKSEWWLRTIGALIPGLVTIWGSIWLTKKWFRSESASIMTGLFMALSSFHIFYSQELRPYSLPTMWAILSMIFLTNWMFTNQAITSKASAKQSNTKSNSKKENIKARMGFILTTIAGLFSSYLYPFFVIGQLAIVFISYRKNRLAMLASVSLAGIAFLPWLPSFFKQLAVGTALRTSLIGWDSVVSISQIKVIPLIFGKFFFGVLDLSLTNPAFLIPPALTIATLVYIFFQTKKTDKIKQLVPLVIWVLIPLLTAFLISFAVPVLRPKRVLFLLPAFFMFFGVLISWGRVQSKPLVRQLSTGLLVFLLLIEIISLSKYWTDSKLQRENWRGAISTLENNYPTNQTVIITAFKGNFAPWQWYSSKDFHTMSSETYQIKDQEAMRQHFKPVAEYTYVVLFDYLRDLTDPADTLPGIIQSYGLKEADLYDYDNIGFIRVYAKPEALMGFDPQSDFGLHSNSDRVTIDPS